jgi:hypothetical protein
MNDRLDAWSADVEWRLRSAEYCDVIRGGRTRGASRLAPLPTGTYVLDTGPTPAPGETPAAEGRFEAECAANATVALGEIGLGSLAPGPYALTLSWSDGGARHENTASFLVTRNGWQAPSGLTRVSRGDVT